MDDKGNIRKEIYTEQHSRDATMTNFLGKPLLMARGQSSEWNPFRKKSGILSVMDDKGNIRKEIY